MNANFSIIQNFLNNLDIKPSRALLKDLILNYKFLNISNFTDLDEKEKQNLIQKVKESKVMIIKQIEESGKNNLILVFEKTLIFHEYSSLTALFISEIHSYNSKISVCILPCQNNSNNAPDNILKEIDKFQKIKFDEIFNEEICNFQSFFFRNLHIHSANERVKKILKKIVPCISAYLIKKSYFRLKKNRIKHFIRGVKNKETPVIINKDEYIELRNIAAGAMFLCILVYHIEREELFVIKKQKTNDIEFPKLIEREINNYLTIRHPFLPKCCGQDENKNYIFIEYINGHTLKSIKELKLNINDKLVIIYELILIIMYFHSKEMVYRDLKPDNIMIDENKMLVLIDFDRLIGIHNKNIIQNIGASVFTDPEVYITKKFTYKNDIYSLEKIIEFIIKDGDLRLDLQTKEYLEISQICKNCTSNFDEKKSPISDIFYEFCHKYNPKIPLKNSFIEFEKISPPQKSLNSDFTYYENKYISCVFDKQFHYFYSMNLTKL